MTKRCLLYLFQAFIFLLPAGAQEIYSSLDASQKNIRIGEQINLRLSFHSPYEINATALSWPQFSHIFQDSLLEIISTGDKKTEIKNNGENIIYQDYTVTCFDSAVIRIEPVVIGMNNAMYPTNSLEITVMTVPVDTAAGPRDIKEIFTAEYTWYDRFLDIIDLLVRNWYWVLSGIILSILLIYFLRKKKQIPEKIIPLIPPKEEALFLLSELEKEQLPERDELKIYYSRITEIIRNFLERRFDFNAPELTSHEILHHLKSIKCRKESVSIARDIFEIADLVKFAKAKTSGLESKRALDLARSFVESIPDPEKIIPAEEVRS